MTRVITVASATAGMGKTAISINLAACLAAKGHRPLVMDAVSDAVFFGKTVAYTLDDVLSGQKTIKDVRLTHFNGIDTLADSQQLIRTGEIDSQAAEHLIRAFVAQSEYDFFIVNSPSGISRHIATLCLAAPELVLVLPPDPGMLAETVGFLNFLTANGSRNAVKVIVNQCRHLEDANRVYSKLKAAFPKRPAGEIQPLGLLPREPRIANTQHQGGAFFLEHPDSNAAVNIGKIADRLIQTGAAGTSGGTIEDFWVRYLALAEQPLQRPAPRDVRDNGAAGSASPPAPDRLSVDMPLAGANGALLDVLNRLTESVAAASRELGSIRRLLEGGQPLQPSVHTASDVCHLETEKQVLDFEAFSRQKKSLE